MGTTMMRSMAATCALKETLVVMVVAGLCCLNHLMFHAAAEAAENKLLIEDEVIPPHKHTLKIIKTEGGDIFDCVDIYKQPAFDHPLLKNHTIQMRPTISPKAAISRNSTPTMLLHFGLKNGGCPQGTVPIQRTRREELIQSKSLLHFARLHKENINAIIDLNAKTYVAEYSTILTPATTYHGTKAVFNLYGFPKLGPLQYTSAELSVANYLVGFKDKINAINVGWVVSQEVNNDTKTRLFGFWTGDGYQSKGCYNIQCEGFIQLSKKITLGIEFAPLSTYDGPQFAIEVLLTQDPHARHWWLYVNGERVGYYPSVLFNTLNSAAKKMSWSGVVSGPKDQPSAPMGSGHFPNEGPNKTGFFKNIKVVDSKFDLRDPYLFSQFSSVNAPRRCYRVGTAGFANDEGYMFRYGGPGGC